MDCFYFLTGCLNLIELQVVSSLIIYDDIWIYFFKSENSINSKLGLEFSKYFSHKNSIKKTKKSRRHKCFKYFSYFFFLVAYLFSPRTIRPIFFMIRFLSSKAFYFKSNNNHFLLKCRKKCINFYPLKRVKAITNYIIKH